MSGRLSNTWRSRASRTSRSSSSVTSSTGWRRFVGKTMRSWCSAARIRSCTRSPSATGPRSSSSTPSSIRPRPWRCCAAARSSSRRPSAWSRRPPATSTSPPGMRSIDVQSKPIVAEGLLAGRYEAGLTHLEHLATHPDELRPRRRDRRNRHDLGGLRNQEAIRRRCDRHPVARALPSRRRRR